MRMRLSSAEQHAVCVGCVPPFDRPTVSSALLCGGRRQRVSEDAITLGNELHRAFADRRVNPVIARREFFFATPAEVRELLLEKEVGGLLGWPLLVRCRRLALPSAS